MSEGKFPEEAVSNPKFLQAVRELKKNRLWFDLPSPYQIKIGKCNYFWTTGTTTIDGVGKIGKRDIKSFVDLVKQRKKRHTALPHRNDGRCTTAPPQLPCLDLSEIAPAVTPPWE